MFTLHQADAFTHVKKSKDFSSCFFCYKMVHVAPPFMAYRALTSELQKKRL